MSILKNVSTHCCSIAVMQPLGWCCIRFTTNGVCAKNSGVRRKFSMGGFAQGHMVVICIWCAPFVTSQFDVIFMFPNQRFGEVCWHNIQTFLHPLPLFLCHCSINYQRSKLGYRKKTNTTIQQFITAKISGCALKQGSKTHSWIRQSNLQLQNEATLMSCRIRAVEHRNSAAGLAGAHPGLQDWILLNYTRIENVHKVAYASKLSIFVMFRSTAKFQFSFFPAETLLANAWMLLC